MPPVAVPTYDQAYGQLGSIYDPQTSSVNTQLAGLQPQQDAQQAGLDQAKVNAFRDITQGANAKGVMFSGVPIDQQAQYVGTKYLPAVANLKQTFANQRTTLLDKINQINAQRATQAQGMVSEAQKNATDQYYKQAQLSLGYARLGASQAAASNKPLSQEQTVAAIRNELNRVKGNDGHVSPYDLKRAYNLFASTGASPNDFWKYYKGYWNDKQSNYGQVFNSFGG